MYRSPLTGSAGAPLILLVLASHRSYAAHSTRLSETLSYRRVCCSSVPHSRSPANAAFPCRFAAYAVAFSPFFPNKLAVAGSANFGLVGNGRLSVLGNGPQGVGVDKV